MPEAHLTHLTLIFSVLQEWHHCPSLRYEPSACRPEQVRVAGSAGLASGLADFTEPLALHSGVLPPLGVPPPPCQPREPAVAVTLYLSDSATVRPNNRPLYGKDVRVPDPWPQFIKEKRWHRILRDELTAPYLSNSSNGQTSWKKFPVGPWECVDAGLRNSKLYSLLAAFSSCEFELKRGYFCLIIIALLTKQWNKNTKNFKF